MVKIKVIKIVNICEYKKFICIQENGLNTCLDSVIHVLTVPTITTTLNSINTKEN